jgi:hypothetical protein
VVSEWDGALRFRQERQQGRTAAGGAVAGQADPNQGSGVHLQNIRIAINNRDPN